MGIIINIDVAAKKMHPGEKITFGSLYFIADRFGDFHLQGPKSSMEEQKQPPLICEFFAVLEEAVDVGPRTLAQHLNRYRRDIFTKLDQESNLEATLRLWEDPN